MREQKIGQYESSYLGRTFDIRVALNQGLNNEYGYFIDCASADPIKKSVLLHFKSRDLSRFSNFLIAAKETYTNWQEIASANGVTELDKEINATNFRTAAGFIHGGWQFDFNVLLKARVKIINGEVLLIINSSQLQSSTNRFMKHNGLYLVFENSNEIDEFLSCIEIDKVRIHFASKNRQTTYSTK